MLPVEIRINILAKLDDLKESHLSEMREYAISKNLQGDPAFNWWIPHVLNKRDRIILLVKKRSARYLKNTHKFSVCLPKSIDEAYKIYKENGNNLWARAISKEMADVRVAFKPLEGSDNAPIWYTFVFCHMNFYVKMVEFHKKACLVASGHKTETPSTMTYAGVVSRETVCLALVIAALNDLDMKCGDVMNM